MNRNSSTLFVLTLWCAGTASASVEVVFQRALTIDRSVNIFASSQFDLNLVFADSFFTPTDPVTLFGGLVISPADAGRTFVANAQNDPGFIGAVQRLTDSQDQFMRLVFTEEASGRSEQRGFRERSFFLGKTTADSPDLAGSQIDSFSLSIDAFTLKPPASGGEAATLDSGLPVQLQMTFTVLGSIAPEIVPEPTTVLVWSGLTILALIVSGAGRLRPSWALVPACRSLIG